MKQTTIKKMLEECENDAHIRIIKDIDNDDKLDYYARGNLRIAVRCTAAFMMYEYLKNNSVVTAKNAIDLIFPRIKNIPAPAAKPGRKENEIDKMFSPK